MSEPQPSDPRRATLDYYERNAGEYEERTGTIDLSPLYAEFLPLLPPGGFILDAGCGTGRDSAAFLDHGFRVLAMDASRAMAERASRRIARPVLQISFDQMQFDHEFDGAWANASLLHVPKPDMPQVFQNFHDALVPGGVFYASFKRGTGEGLRDGRFFNDYTEEELRRFVAGLDNWSLLRVWRTDDIGQQRPWVEWVNLLARARRA